MQSPDLSFVVPSISRDMRSLYEAHFPFVWRYMAHRGVPQASLDDLVHSVFRIVREHPSRRDPSRPRSVVVCMISRQVLREFKKRNANAAPPDQQQEGDGDGPTRIFSRDAAAEMLDATLDNLTEMQREVFLLCAGEKMSCREVGDALGVAETTIEMRLKSAQQRVAAFVERLRAHPIWETLNDASPRGLLEAAQAARTPSDRDRERVFAAMLASSMTSTPPPVELLSLPPTQAQSSRVPPPPRMPRMHRDLQETTPTLPPGRPYAGWAAVTLVALVVGASSFFVLSNRQPDATRVRADATPIVITPRGEAPSAAADSPSADAPPPVDAPPAVAPEAPTVESEAAAPTHRSPRAKKARRSTREPPAAPRSDDRGARQLFAAERALHSGDPHTALELVREHAARYPESQLATERNALRAQILCDLGRTRAARRVVLELEADHAEHTVLASVDQACMGPD